MDKDNTRIVNSELDKYPMIKCHLGSLIRKRMKLPLVDRGILVGNLLDIGIPETARDLEMLENDVKCAQDCCRGFKTVFHRTGLPEDSDHADGKILDKLAEIKAVAFLHSNRFSSIARIPESKEVTVDFTAERDGASYAVEVTRIGLAESHRKKPKYLVPPTPIPRNNILGIRPLRGEFFIIGGSDNLQQFTNTLMDAVVRKYSQIRSFCQRQQTPFKGVVIITAGRDYFVSKYARRELDMFPATNNQALRKTWDLLHGQNIGEYLHHIVFIMGKNSKQTIIYPELKD